MKLMQEHIWFKVSCTLQINLMDSSDL